MANCVERGRAAGDPVVGRADILMKISRYLPTFPHGEKVLSEASDAKTLICQYQRRSEGQLVSKNLYGEIMGLDGLGC